MATLVPPDVRLQLSAAYPLDAQDGAGFDARVALVFTAPGTRNTLYVTELAPEDGDLLLFGYCVSPLGPDCDEWGYARLSELEGVALKNLRVERDGSIEPGAHTVRALLARRAAACAP